MKTKILLISKKMLFVKEKNGFWGFSRQGLIDDNYIENLFETFVENIGQELGIKGLASNNMNFKFYPYAYLFNVERQEYDQVRSKSEGLKKRPARGKIYHLSYMGYKGDDKFSSFGTNDLKLQDYKWVSDSEAILLTDQNQSIKRQGISSTTFQFHNQFLIKLINIRKTIDLIKDDSTDQLSIFGGSF